MRRHKEKVNPGKIRLASLISFLAGLAQALFAYIMSTYLKLAAGTENIGIFYLISYAAILVILLNFPRAVKKFGKANVFFFSALLKVSVLLGLLFASPGITSILLVMAYMIFLNLEWVGLDAILESYSNDRMSGRIRGKFLTLMNVGILFGPFFSTEILSRFDYYGIFLAVTFLSVAILFISILGFRKVNHRYRGTSSFKVILKKVVRRKDILRVLHVSFALEFFYALMIIYTPIYLLNLGLSWKEIGIIFSWMLIPFVFIQYPAGLLADKRTGEKEFLIASVAIMGFSAAAVFFITSSDVFVWSAVLFSGRIGAALVEILRDSYFYKRIGAQDVDLIDVFRAARPLAYILAAISSALLLIFLPMKWIFILTGVAVLSALFSAFRLVDNKSERETDLLSSGVRNFIR